MLKTSIDVESENKNQRKTNAEFVSDQKLTGKVGSNSQPKVPPKSDVHALKSTNHRQANPRLKQTTESAAISSSTLRELYTDLNTRTAAGRTVSASSNKKQTFHYKPAHHSAPFKTTPLPPGKSKLPPVCRPGSRNTAGRQSAAARGIDSRGVKIGVAGSAAKGIRRIVDDRGRKSVSSLSSVSTNDASSSVGRNSPSNVDSGHEVSQGQGIDLQQLRKVSDKRTSEGLETELTSCTGIPNSGEISVSDATIQEKHGPGQTTSLWQTDDSRTSVATSAVIGRQSRSASTGGISTSEISPRANTVVQSETGKEWSRNIIHSQQDVAKDSSSSFTLLKDGYVLCDLL